jgi:tRNA pseudouridine32 synthase / 23S rRNA pseudouridine746 synthase
MLAGMDIAVSWFDEHLIVVDKPSGLLAVPGRGDDKQDNALSRARQRWPDAMVVHRLDMATSGLLLLSRGASAQRQLSAAFAGRRVLKHYAAVVEGRVQGVQGQIDLPLAADWPNRPRQRVDRLHGKPSCTHWRVLGHEPGPPRTRLWLQPITGRSHQLRVHLQAIGHPIVGDALYGAHAPAAASSRLLLHAARLELDHPVTGSRLVFESPPPF